MSKSVQTDDIFFIIEKLQDRHPDRTIIGIIRDAIVLYDTQFGMSGYHSGKLTDSDLMRYLKTYYERTNK